MIDTAIQSLFKVLCLVSIMIVMTVAIELLMVVIDGRLFRFLEQKVDFFLYMRHYNRQKKEFLERSSDIRLNVEKYAIKEHNERINKGAE